MTTDPAVFRNVLGHFATGVTVVTGMDGDDPVGFTCQAFSSLSLDPPLVLIAPARTSTSWPRIAKGGFFCINVLASGEADTARHFAVSGGRKFDGLSWSESRSGSPVLGGVLAYVDCSLEAVHDGGDHVIAVGRVLDLSVAPDPGGPLLFYRGSFGHFATAPAPQEEDV
ncbi:MAG TPA: flavin reductase family protein [Acidimicrobiales bacterium]|nr:flavin reductase family protein [Acidimicrobiales bacterium]